MVKHNFIKMESYGTMEILRMVYVKMVHFIMKMVRFSILAILKIFSLVVLESTMISKEYLTVYQTMMNLYQDHIT